MRIAVAHLFATGPVGSGGAPVHVGLQSIGSEPEPMQEWICRPPGNIRRRLSDASRLDKAALSDAPAWDVVASSVREALTDYEVLYILGSGLERSWFEGILPGYPGTRFVDLRRLVQFFLPNRDIDDLVALCEMTVSGYRRRKPQLPFLIRLYRELLREIVEVVLTSDNERTHPMYAWLTNALHKGGPFDFRAVLDLVETAHELQWTDEYELPQFSKPRLPRLWPPDGRGLLDHFRSFLPEPTDTKMAERAPLIPVKPDFLDAAFDGLRKREKGDLRDRPAQRKYAHFFGNAFNDGGIYAAEAGTGTGKTLGYLVPACEFVRRNPGHKVLIATATKTLQDQVLHEELPRLTYEKGLHQDVSSAVLKGKGNYLCAGALADLHREVFASGSADEMLGWLYLYIRLRFAEGTIDDVPQALVKSFPILWSQLAEVNAEGACTSDQCRVGIRCIYPTRLREALQADVVVTNHHKLGLLPGALLERIAVLVVDEANLLPDNLRSALTVTLAPYALRRDLLDRLVARGRRRRGFLEVVKDFIQSDVGRPNEGPDGPNASALEQIERIMSACAGIPPRLEEIGSLCAETETEQRWQEIERKRPGFERALLAQLEVLEEGLREIAVGLRRLAGSKRYEPLEGAERRGTAGLRREKARVERYAETAERWRDTATAIRQEYPSRNCVHTFLSHERAWSAARIPFDLTRIIDSHLRESFRSIVLTSATLYVENRLDFYRSELGLTSGFTDVARLTSPFDYEGKVYGAVTTFIPAYSYNATQANHDRWMDDIVDTLRVLTVATEGRSLILCTSTQEMRAVHERLCPLLEPFDIEVLIQNGPSRAELRRFRENEHTVLFGVDRFWVGIDVPGPSLSHVIVVRLPNPSLGDPLVSHRLAYDGDRMWETYYRPAARLRLRQGFGRLIRHEDDRGMFTVLDARLATNATMRSMQDELPIHLAEVATREPRPGQLDFRRMLDEGLARTGLMAEFKARGIDPFAAVAKATVESP